MPEKFEQLIRDYRDGKITRRQFIHKAAAITGSLVIADGLLEKLARSPVYAAQVDMNDSAVSWREIEYPGKVGPVFGYLPARRRRENIPRSLSFTPIRD